MERLVNQLSDKVHFTDKEFATRYLSYNTTWSIIKKNKEIINNISGHKINFQELVIAAKFCQHYNNAYSIVIRKVEHYIKVSISYNYQIKSTEEKLKIEDFIRKLVEDNKYRHYSDINNIDNPFEIINILYYKELVRLNNFILTTKKIAGDTNLIRNAASHHDSLILTNKVINSDKNSRLKRLQDLNLLNGIKIKAKLRDDNNFAYSMLNLEALVYLVELLTVNDSTNKSKFSILNAVKAN